MPRVLIVDDSATMRSVLRRCLAFCGVEADEIEEAENGAVALERLEQGMPKLVLCDVNMPVMTGTELLAELQARGLVPAHPVVMVTSHAGARQALEMVRAGARKVVRKPFNPQSLYLELEEYLNEPEPQLEQVASVESVVEQEQEPQEDPLRQRTIDAVKRTLEQFAFIAPDEVTSRPSHQVLFQAQISFRTPQRVDLRVAMTRDAASILCQNLLGEDPGNDDTARCDAVAEIANVLAGVVFDPSEDPHFGLPGVSVLAPGAEFPPSAVSFALDGGECPEVVASLAPLTSPVLEAVHG